MPLNVPTYEKFEALKAELAEVRELLRYLLAQQPDWLSANQACQALQCSRTTFYRLTMQGKLTPRYQNSKPLHEAAQLRTYIESTQVSPRSANDRLLFTLQDKYNK